MSTEWFQKSPGQDMAQKILSDDQAAILVCSLDHPDWVRLPQSLPTSDAGAQVKVIGLTSGPCPTCKAPCRSYVLERGYIVRECTSCRQFFFLRDSR